VGSKKEPRFQFRELRPKVVDTPTENVLEIGHGAKSPEAPKDRVAAKPVRPSPDGRPQFLGFCSKVQADNYRINVLEARALLGSKYYVPLIARSYNVLERSNFNLMRRRRWRDASRQRRIEASAIDCDDFSNSRPIEYALV
jgi:hypothetical protein